MNHIMREFNPWMTDHSPLQTRHLDRGGSRRQADIICYVTEASPAASASVPLSGLRVLEPDAAAGVLPPAAAIPLPAGQRFSPVNATRTGPQKYFLAESYSGDSDLSREGKLGQLETLLGFTVSRWQDRQGAAAPALADFTSIIGTAGLVFSAVADRRMTVLDEACAMVQANAGPHVRRLIQAGRFFVMVLDRSQTPLTNIAREQAVMAQQLAAMGQQQAAMGQQQAAMGQQQAAMGQRLEAIPEEVADLVVARMSGL